jgi:dipeptidyl aminopeptidase/acylaminoacyl peptidase
MHYFQSGGKRIGIDLIEPTSLDQGTRLFPAVLLLHGAGGNVSFCLHRFSLPLARLGIAIYAVHYFDRTDTLHADAQTITDGHHFAAWLDTISDSLKYLATRPGIDPKRISILGISLGAFLALSLATTAKGIRAIVEISGGLPSPYAQQATSTYPPTLILHGDADTVVPVSQAHDLNHLLDQTGTPHQLQLFPGEGHWFSAGVQLRILASVAQFLGKYL